MQYATYCDRIVGKSFTTYWEGYVELNGQKEQLKFRKFVVKNDVIQGSGADSEGDFTINGYVKKNDVKFNVYYFGTKKSVIYFGTLTNGVKIVGNQFKDNIRSKLELYLVK